jgi:hypothetical protein
MLAITPDNHISNVKLNGGSDFGFAFGDKARFRVSVLKSKGNYGMVLRQIPYNRMFGLREIGLPDKIKELLYRPRGLILVTGPTGSGKSTTLASMVNYINENRDGHIITIEDPIEYYHAHKQCIVTQREIGVDVPSPFPRRSGARCVRIPTSSWSVKCATWKRSRPPSAPPKRGTWCSARCTRTARPRRSTASSTPSRPT